MKVIKCDFCPSITDVTSHSFFEETFTGGAGSTESKHLMFDACETCYAGIMRGAFAKAGRKNPHAVAAMVPFLKTAAEQRD